MPIEIGNSFLIKPNRIVLPHLWIVISSPYDNPERVAIVNISTWRDEATHLNDGSCIINKGEHNFIKSKSYVVYREAKTPLVSQIEQAIQSDLIEPNDDCTTGLIAKIILGAAQSQFTPNKILRVLQIQELI